MNIADAAMDIIESDADTIARLEAENEQLKTRAEEAEDGWHGALLKLGRPEQRQTHDVLAEVADTLGKILTTLEHANSAAREGAVSSVEIKFLAPTKDHPEGKPQPVIKTYAGSVPPVEEAIEAYGRAFLMAQQASVEGWEQTLDVLQAERKVPAT